MGRSDKNGVIPDGWRIARLGDVATLRPSQKDSDTDNDLPYVGLKHIANGGTLIGVEQAEQLQTLINQEIERLKEAGQRRRL